MNDLIETCYYW